MIPSNNEALAPIATDALKQVIDPEIGLNIVDLGLIYSLDFQVREKRITVEMTLTTQFCPMGEAITGSVSEVMEETFGGYTIGVKLVFEPRWGHHLISEEGQEFLTR